MSKTINIEFAMPADRVVELEILLKEVGLPKMVDLFSHALDLLVWAINERKAGHAIGSIDIKNGSYAELETPIFDAYPLD